MKFIAIAATMDWKSKKMDIVHKLLFHGDAIRADAPANPAEMGPGSWSHSLGDDLSHPLLLIRSGVYVPPIFNPGVALVVREEVYQRVSQFSGLRFADARPSKLINCWKPIGDFSFYDSTDPWIRRNRRRPDELLDWMPDDPTLLATFPKCRELVGFNVYGEHEKGTHSVSVNFVMDDDTETEVGFTCSSSVIDRHTLLWGMVFFLRRDLFDLLQDIIDYNHFALKPVDL